MISVFIWYLLITLIGLAALPLAFRFLKFLPDRGYTLARPLGLLLTGFIYWLFGSFGVLQNNSGGMMVAIIIVAGVNLALLREGLSELRQFFKSHGRLILIAELLFAFAFAAWAVVRSANPEITYTEKPMELAFLNSILRSPGVPPNDPWLSGYAISYYYFGYIIVSLLIRLSGVSASFGFNLGISAWFALTALAAYGVLFNLLAAVRLKNNIEPRKVVNSAAGWALLAPFFILIVSNLAGILDILHARGLFWTQHPDGTWTSNFWKWLAIKEFDVPPPQPFAWLPHRGGWMWWRGSRVLQDFNLLGQPEEVIDEFPFFSYLLADMHPHVLTMPFVLLVIGLAFNLFLKNGETYEKFNMIRQLRSWRFWITGLILGGLAFLNTWDFPIYVVLYSAVIVLVGVQHEGWSIQRLWDFLGTALMLVLAGVLLYLPFYIGFASQAGGFLPSLIYFTRGKYFWVMFAPMLIPILIWLVYKIVKHVRGKELRTGLLTSTALIAVLWALMLAFGVLIQVLASANTGEAGAGAATLLARMGGSGSALFGGLMLARLISPGTWLTLLVLLGLGWGLVLALTRKNSQVSEEVISAGDEINKPKPIAIDAFVVLLIIVGGALALFPEFFYLRDQFGTRMNTIFKFYIQIWIIWGIAAGYATAELWGKLRGIGGILFRATWSILIVMALCYPAIELPYKMGLPKPVSELTLDGTAYLKIYDPDEIAAYQWLAQANYGVVAEAVGGSYNPDFARVSTHTGLPTVLGWVGHELQWRGGTKEMGSRDADIATLYSTSDWTEAKSIIDRYGIRYVYIGPSERSTYTVSEAKLNANMVTVYSNPSVVIYEFAEPDQPAQ